MRANDIVIVIWIEFRFTGPELLVDEDREDIVLQRNRGGVLYRLLGFE